MGAALSRVKVHTKLHPGHEWRISHILMSKDVDDVISRLYTFVCAKLAKRHQKNGER